LNRSGSNDLVIQNNTWSGASNNVDYNESFTYDANGNILTLTRYGTSAQQQSMDELTYNYYSGTNRLEYVEDIVDPDNYTTDIDDQNSGNYTYDEIGNLKSDAQEGISAIDWTVYGKIKSITKTGTGDHLEFKYDAQGNRIAKIAKPSTTLGTPSTWTTTYYLRDAQGNALATYEDKPNDAGFHIMENALYGSSRLGIMRREIDLLNLPSGGEGHYSGTRGKKAFELSNHLGNVLEVVSDQKQGIDDTGSDGIADYYTANVRSTTDYYAFGAQMPGRVSTSADNYRYGFNGKENDNEVKGNGNQQDYGMRIYDPRLGKFLSVDPITKEYPELTPYQFASNTPIQAVDLDGLEAFFVHGTLSNSRRWTENSKTIPTLIRLTNNKSYNADFNWKASLTNNETDRTIAAKQLALYVIAHHVKGEEITLIGHSHGGNVSIQAADIIYNITGQKVNIITIGTPAYNGTDDKENPKNHVGINDHKALWNNIDGVSGGLAGDDNYTNSSKTDNIEIDVDLHYKKETIIKDRWGQKSTMTTYNKIGAHSFDVEHPEVIDKAINQGKIKKVNPVIPK